MRILLVVNGTEFGGTESNVARIAATLRKRGHDVHVLSLKRIGPVGRAIERTGTVVSTLEMGESVGLAQLLRYSVALARWLRGREFDVIHSFLPRANVMSRIANRLAEPRRPHIANEESTDFRRPRHVRNLEWLTARWSERIIAVSAAVRDVLVVRGRVSSRKVVIIATGVDLEAIERAPVTDIRAELGLAPSATVLCSIGRLTRVKGHSHLIRALPELVARDPGVHLVLAGGGPEERRLRLEADARNVESRVHLLGFRADAVGIMKSADLFVLSSLEEGLPVVLLEAMGCALPIVATQVGGVGEVISDGENGLLVPPAEVWDRRGAAAAPAPDGEGAAVLTRAIGRLLGDQGEARRLGAAARRLVERSHSVERQVTALERLYGTLVNGNAVDPAAIAGRAIA